MQPWQEHSGRLWFQGFFRRCVTGPCCGNGGKDRGGKTEAAKTESDTAAAGTDASCPTEPTELIFIFADGDEGAKASMNEIVNRFNETYQDITVKIQPGNGGAYSEFFLKDKGQRGGIPGCDGNAGYPDVCTRRHAGTTAGGYYFLI